MHVSRICSGIAVAAALAIAALPPLIRRSSHRP